MDEALSIKTDERNNDANEESQFEGIVRKYLTINYDGVREYRGYFNGESTLNLFLTELRAIGCSFATLKSRNGCEGYCFRQLLGGCPIDFFGSIFQILQSKTMECVQGCNYKSSVVPNNVPDDHPTKRRFYQQPTKKIGCIAEMRYRKIKVFPEFEIPFYSRYLVNKTKHNLGDRLCQDKLPPPESFIRYYVAISKVCAHNHSFKSSMVCQKPIPEVVKRIEESLLDNRTSASALKCDVKSFVSAFSKDLLYKPSPLNSAFFPSKKVTKNNKAKVRNGIKIYKNKKSEVKGPKVPVEISKSAKIPESSFQKNDTSYLLVSKNLQKENIESLSAVSENLPNRNEDAPLLAENLPEVEDSLLATENLSEAEDSVLITENSINGNEKSFFLSENFSNVNAKPSLNKNGNSFSLSGETTLLKDSLLDVQTSLRCTLKKCYDMTYSCLNAEIMKNLEREIGKCVEEMQKEELRQQYESVFEETGNILPQNHYFETVVMQF